MALRRSMLLLAAAMAVGLGFVTVKADDNNGDVRRLQGFVNKASLSLAEAIKSAEKETGGRAIDAQIAYANEHKGSKAEGFDHYIVKCLAGDKILEVCVDGINGNIIDKRDLGPGGNITPHGLTRNTGAINKTGDSETSYGEDAHEAMRIQKASDLMGKNVVNPQGQNLGEVEDLAIDPDHDFQVAYAVISFGGFLGIGEKWFAVPLGAMTLPADAKHFVMDIDKSRLKNATGFDKEHWPKMADLSWATEVHKFYGKRPYWEEQNNDASPETPLRIVKASELKGRSVENDRGEKIGEIQNLAIDPDAGRVVYVVLSFGGLLGMGDKYFAVPPSVLKIPGAGTSMAVLSFDKERLKNAQGFDKNHWPNLADPTFVTSTYEFYGANPDRANHR